MDERERERDVNERNTTPHERAREHARQQARFQERDRAREQARFQATLTTMLWRYVGEATATDAELRVRVASAIDENIALIAVGNILPPRGDPYVAGTSILDLFSDPEVPFWAFSTWLSQSEDQNQGAWYVTQLITARAKMLYPFQKEDGARWGEWVKLLWKNIEAKLRRHPDRQHLEQHLAAGYSGGESVPSLRPDHRSWSFNG